MSERTKQEPTIYRPAADLPLPTMEYIGPKGKEPGMYLCCACWRRIPVGQHSHACFYEE